MKSALTTTIEVLQERANDIRQQEQELQQERALLNKKEDALTGVREDLLKAIETVQSVWETYKE